MLERHSTNICWYPHSYTRLLSLCFVPKHTHLQGMNAEIFPWWHKTREIRIQPIYNPGKQISSFFFLLTPPFVKQIGNPLGKFNYCVSGLYKDTYLWEPPHSLHITLNDLDNSLSTRRTQASPGRTDRAGGTEGRFLNKRVSKHLRQD